MKTTHTPGPWNVCKHAHRWIETTDGRECIAEVLVRENMSANARLIAAAPELLEALRNLVHPMADDADLVKARAAIAKAEGAE